MKAVLHVGDVHKSYLGAQGTVPVLRGVGLSLEAGETLALTGESGSGKSTLLHIVAGLETMDSGEIVVSGTSISELGDTDLARLRRTKIAVIFQQFNLISSLTVAANIAFQARLGGKVDRQRLSYLASVLGLSEHLDKFPEALSGGQQQRVAIARALAARPQLLLADEPTGNLDEATANAVMDAMLSLVSEMGTSLLMVTHSPKMAARMARQIHLSGGRIA